MGSARAAIATTAGYIAIMALAVGGAAHVLGLPYGTPGMVRVLLPVEALLAVYVIVAARRIHGDWRCGFDRLDPRGLLWMLPHSLAVALLLALLLPAFVNGPWARALPIVATTALVGFGEELMFRGILLRSLLEVTGRGTAIIGAALGFSLLHADNALGMQPLEATAMQMVLTFVFGLSFGVLALRLNSLLPLMVFHALWDMLLFLGGLYQVDLLLASFFGILANALVGLVLWVFVLRRGVSSSAR